MALSRAFVSAAELDLWLVKKISPIRPSGNRPTVQMYRNPPASSSNVSPRRRFGSRSRHWIADMVASSRAGAGAPVGAKPGLRPRERLTWIVKCSICPESDRRRTFAACWRAQLGKRASGDRVTARSKKLRELGARQVLAVNGSGGHDFLPFGKLVNFAEWVAIPG